MKLLNLKLLVCLQIKKKLFLIIVKSFSKFTIIVKFLNYFSNILFYFVIFEAEWEKISLPFSLIK